MKKYLRLIVCTVAAILAVSVGCAKFDEHHRHERKKSDSNNLVRTVDAGVIKEVSPIQDGRMLIKTDKLVLVTHTDGIEIGAPIILKYWKCGHITVYTTVGGVEEVVSEYRQMTTTHHE